MRVTFGRYIPKNSLIHGMDARFKLVATIILIASIFLKVHFAGYLICAVIIFSIFTLSKLSFRMLAGLLAPVAFVFIIIFFMNAWITHPSNETLGTLLENKDVLPTGVWVEKTKLVSYGLIYIKENAESAWHNISGLKDVAYIQLGHFVKIGAFWLSEKSVYTALQMAIRIYLMIALTCILTGTTSPLQLTLAIEDILTPLKWIGVPVYIISMIISIALRMIPTLIDEAGRIIKAQASRGIDIKNGKIKDKAKGMAALIIPLLVSAFQKAEDLSYAMESRGYDPYSERTRYIQFKFKFFDLFILLVSICLLVLMIFISTNAFGVFHPFLQIPWIDKI